MAYHKDVINATKTVLIPDAQNAELKSALQGAEPLFEGHLLHAEHVQSAIAGREDSLEMKVELLRAGTYARQG